MKGKMYKDRVGGGATCGDVDDGNKQATRLGGIRLGECLLGVRRWLVDGQLATAWSIHIHRSLRFIQWFLIYGWWPVEDHISRSKLPSASVTQQDPTRHTVIYLSPM